MSRSPCAMYDSYTRLSPPRQGISSIHLIGTEETQIHQRRNIQVFSPRSTSLMPSPDPGKKEEAMRSAAQRKRTCRARLVTMPQSFQPDKKERKNPTSLARAYMSCLRIPYNIAKRCPFHGTSLAWRAYLACVRDHLSMLCLGRGETN